MTRPPRPRPLWIQFLSLAVAIVVVDQATKAWIVAQLAGGGEVRILGDYLRLIYTENSGALFGILREQALLFAIVSVAVAVLIVAVHARAGRSPYLTITLGLLLGGWAGNFIDRVTLGHVVDFVDMGIGTVRFWAYNVADSCITVALLLLVLMAVHPAVASWRTGRTEEP